MLHVADNTYDRDPLDLRIARPTDSFAERVFILKVLSHERFIGETNKRCFVVKVCGTKISPALQRNLHDLEVVAEHAASLQTRLITRCDWRPAVDQKVVIERVAAKWEVNDYTLLAA